jgi:hypothetical protein
MTPQIDTDEGRLFQNMLDIEEPDTIILSDTDGSGHRLARLERNTTKITTMLPFLAQWIGEIKTAMKEHNRLENLDHEILCQRVGKLEQWYARMVGAAAVIVALVGGTYLILRVIEFASKG